MTPVHLPASNMVREAGVEPAASRLSIECSNHAELFPGAELTHSWSPVPDSNWLFRITGPAHRQLCLQGFAILEPMERIERSSVAYHATALPLSYIGWSQRGYSKPRPPRYECGALLRGAQRTRTACAPALELLRRRRNWSECGESNSVARTGDPVPNQWATPAEILERTEIIEISSLGWRPRAHPIYHARSSRLL